MADQADDAEEYYDSELPEALDLSEVEVDEGVGEVLPPGSYNGWVESTDYRPSANSGDPMIEWVIQVEKPDGSGTVPLWYYTSFGETSVGRTKATLSRFFPDVDWRNVRPGDLAEQLAGMRVTVQLRVKTNPPSHDYPGKRNQVRRIIPQAAGFLEQ